MEVDNSNSPQTRNNLIPISEINNFLDSIVKIEYVYIKKNNEDNSFNNIIIKYLFGQNEEEEKKKIGTGFFIKIKLGEKNIPFICTAKHVIKKGVTEVRLILYKKDKNNENIKINLSLDGTKKIIKKFIDVIFIEILDSEFPSDEKIKINFLTIDEKYLFNPFNYINSQAIMIGYPLKYLNNGDDTEPYVPLISNGRIIKIKENDTKVVHNMETDKGSSGAPICIINENNEIKLIAVHQSTDPNEKKIYNEGYLLGPILKKFLEYNILDINLNNDNNKIENIIKIIYDKFEILKQDLINRNKYHIFEDEFINIMDYPKFLFYYNQIEDECKMQSKKRLEIYYNIFRKYILKNSNNLLEEDTNKFLTFLGFFEDIKSTYGIIKEENKSIIKCFNLILLSDDNYLKVILVYFISGYINALNEKNGRYKLEKTTLKTNKMMNINLLNKLKLIRANENNIIAFKYFFDEIKIDKKESFFSFSTIFNLFNFNVISLWSTSTDDYNTTIIFEQNNNNDANNNNNKANNNNNSNNNNKEFNYQGNCFKTYRNGLVITPFTFYKYLK